MEKKLNTPLTADEIDFRIQSINKGGYATILAYKDARVDMNRLDEVVGKDYWQAKYELINGNLFCSIGVYNQELKEWVWKQNVGTESMTEKEKGQASDAFKRAGFCWGIGRELYDYPIIQVKLNKDEWELKDGKARQTWNLKLKDWTWFSEFDDEGKLSLLRAVDDNMDERYVWPQKVRREVKKTANKHKLTPEVINKLKAKIESGLGTIDEAATFYGIDKEELTQLINK